MEDQRALQGDSQPIAATPPPRPPVDPLDSGLRRKFLLYCEENPGAEECRIYEV